MTTPQWVAVQTDATWIRSDRRWYEARWRLWCALGPHASDRFMSARTPQEEYEQVEYSLTESPRSPDAYPPLLPTLSIRGSTPTTGQPYIRSVAAV